MFTKEAGNKKEKEVNKRVKDTKKEGVNKGDKSRKKKEFAKEARTLD